MPLTRFRKSGGKSQKKTRRKPGGVQPTIGATGHPELGNLSSFDESSLGSPPSEAPPSPPKKKAASWLEQFNQGIDFLRKSIGGSKKQGPKKTRTKRHKKKRTKHHKKKRTKHRRSSN